MAKRRKKGRRRAARNCVPCKKGFSLGQHNPRTGRRYKRTMCIRAPRRGKMRTHAPRKCKARSPFPKALNGLRGCGCGG